MAVNVLTSGGDGVLNTNPTPPPSTCIFGNRKNLILAITVLVGVLLLGLQLAALVLCALPTCSMLSALLVLSIIVSGVLFGLAICQIRKDKTQELTKELTQVKADLDAEKKKVQAFEDRDRLAMEALTSSMQASSYKELLAGITENSELLTKFEQDVNEGIQALMGGLGDGSFSESTGDN
ncbi:hypothetical protein [Chlamydia vaughanii]|uniref:hypothetical protein n=1 Tax=Chlamydia vaughanii TaxID=3112552 RepID=UPI0032B0F7D0